MRVDGRPILTYASRVTGGYPATVRVKFPIPLATPAATQMEKLSDGFEGVFI